MDVLTKERIITFFPSNDRPDFFVKVTPKYQTNQRIVRERKNAKRYIVWMKKKRY